jgi:hypothetical protein
VSWLPDFEAWRFLSTFTCLGGDFLSFGTLIDIAVIVETVGRYESVLQYTRPWRINFELPRVCNHGAIKKLRVFSNECVGIASALCAISIGKPPAFLARQGATWFGSRLRFYRSSF